MSQEFELLFLVHQ
jgi:hypothetical protein